MAQFFARHKRLFAVLVAALGAVCAALYLRAMFLPGLWFGDIFLYKRADGSFAGSAGQNSCQMQREGVGNEVQISFTLNGVTNEYELLRGSGDSLTIHTNGAQTFDGTLYQTGGSYMALSSDGSDGGIVEITVTTQSGAGESEELSFPSSSWLASAAFGEKLDTRGRPVYLLAIVLTAVWLVLDIAFPDLFYTLRHGFATYGGQPSDWYRFDQKIARVVMLIAIAVFAVLSFATH